MDEVYLLFFVTLILNLPVFLCHLTDTKCFWRINDTKDLDEDCILGIVLVPRTNQKKYFNEFLDTNLPPQKYQLLLALAFATEEISRNPVLFSNMSLTLMPYISFCNLKVFQDGIHLLIDNTDMKVNYICKGSVTELMLTGSLWTTSAKIAGLSYSFPFLQLTYGPFHPILSDLEQFPYLYQIALRDTYLASAMISLMLYFSWTWVGLIVSDDEQGVQFLSNMKEEMQRNRVCLAFLNKIPANKQLYMERFKIYYDRIVTSTTKAVIIYGDKNSNVALSFPIWEYLSEQKIWVTTFQLDIVIQSKKFYPDQFHGTFSLSHHHSEISGLKTFIQALNYLKYPDDVSLIRLGWLNFNCSVLHSFYNIRSNCSFNTSLEWIIKHNFDLAISEASYNIYNAVYVLAHSIHKMLLQKYDLHLVENNSEQKIDFLEVKDIMRNINFINPLGDPVTMYQRQNRDAEYDIFSILNTHQSLQLKVKIGQFTPHYLYGKQLYLSEDTLSWATGNEQIPSSVCSVFCSPGFKKSPQEGKAVCCFDCISCPENEISNSTDMDECMKCPDDQYANAEHTHCLQKAVIFLSYEDPIGMILACTALLFSTLTVLVLGLFVKHKDTPIVKSNNWTLSYILLISLTFCFLCSLLYIGHPKTVTCILQQTVFVVLFTVAISTVLAKTIIVVLAFRLTGPQRKFTSVLMSAIPKFIILLCMLIQLIMCGIWLKISPPFVSTDLYSHHGQIIIVCNKGSIAVFYCVLGYLGSLALGSFTVAFFARNLPDTFNEAKCLTFSTLVFCSVWVTFIPVYHSSKGKNMVAVEVFSILASSLGLLGCIFFPKCHIILLRPDKNVMQKFSDKTYS